MASIPVADLKPGMRLAYDLRDRGGRLLLAARRPLTEVVIGALAARSVRELPLRSPDELPQGVRDENGPRRSWLMAEASVQEQGDGWRGEEGTNEGLDLMEAIAASEPVVTERDVREGARVRAALRRASEGVIAHRSARWKRLGMRVRVGTWEEMEQGGDGELLTERESLWSAERIIVVRRLFARLAQGETTGAGTVNALVEEMTGEAMRDGAGLLREIIEGVRGAERMFGAQVTPLAVHGYATACVSAVIAARLGWDGAQIRSAALAGMLADCGLALLTWDVRSVPRELTDVEQNALRRHTAYSAAMLEMLRPGSVEESIPEEVQLAAYQHHEREDGSGYPNRVRGEQIHDLARLVAVADVFIGLVAARPDRPGMAPSSALAEVARQANSGVLALLPARALAEVMVSASVGGGAVEVRGRDGMRMAA
jgi:HD-GYP domain-containing protein (c-di-GMP phosphodiesterase class II)